MLSNEYTTAVNYGANCSHLCVQNIEATLLAHTHAMLLGWLLHDGDMVWFECERLAVNFKNDVFQNSAFPPQIGAAEMYIVVSDMHHIL